MQLKNHAVMIGMSRSGTTYMYHSLSNHPDIFVPARKEIGFFSHHYDKGHEWYKEFFKMASNDKKTIDICGVYFTVEESLERLKQLDESVKFILCFRDPYEWIFSLYEHYTKQFDMPDFSTFLEGHEVKREGTSIKFDFTNSQISKRIEAYREAFGDRLLIYDFAYFNKNQLSVMNTIERFLGVKPFFSNENNITEKINARGAKKISHLYRILHKAGLADFIAKNLPRNLVINIRKYLEKKAVHKVVKENITYSASDMNKIKTMFLTDHEYYINIFKKSPMIFGNDSES